jgi:hypothetical protein
VQGHRGQGGWQGGLVGDDGGVLTSRRERNVTEERKGKEKEKKEIAQLPNSALSSLVW